MNIKKNIEYIHKLLGQPVYINHQLLSCVHLLAKNLNPDKKKKILWFL